MPLLAVEGGAGAEDGDAPSLARDGDRREARVLLDGEAEGPPLLDPLKEDASVRPLEVLDRRGAILAARLRGPENFAYQVHLDELRDVPVPRRSDLAIPFRSADRRLHRRAQQEIRLRQLVRVYGGGQARGQRHRDSDQP